MAYELADGDVVLFPNEKKSKDKQPDWRGKIRIEGKDYEIVMWNKTSSRGTTFLAGKMDSEVTEKKPTSSFQSQPQPSLALKQSDPFGDDAPW